MKKPTWKQVGAMITALVMVIGMLPLNVLAAEAEPTEKTVNAGTHVTQTVTENPVGGGYYYL